MQVNCRHVEKYHNYLICLSGRKITLSSEHYQVFFQAFFVREHLNYYFAVSLSSNFPSSLSGEKGGLLKQFSPNRCLSFTSVTLHYCNSN